MGLPQFTLEVDLASDGLFSTDWTPYLEAVERVGLSRDSAVDDYGPRRMRVILNNDDARFSPKNVLGPYFGQLEKGKLIRLKVKVTTPAITNLVKNPSAETDLVGWTVGFAGGGTGTRETDTAKHGAYSLRVIETAPGGWKADQTVSFTPAQSAYTTSVWVLGIGKSLGKNVRIEIAEIGGAAGEQTTLSDYVKLTKVWQRIEVTRTVFESDRTGLRLRIRREDADYVFFEVTYIDSLQLELGSDATLYVDGDQPGAAWDSVVHASISSRGADPEFTRFVGELDTFSVTRKNNVGEAQFEATGFLETALRTNISAGPFMREEAQILIQRVLDVLEANVAKRVFGLGGELWVDPANRNDGNTWVTVAGQITSKFDAGEAGDDPVLFETVEGDNIVLFQTSGPANSAEGYVDLFGALTVNKNYTFTGWIRAISAGAVGETVIVTVNTNVGAVGLVNHVLTNDWTRIRITGLVPSGATFVRWLVAGLSFGSAVDTFAMDGFHASPSFSAKGLIDEPTFLGTKWATEIEYDDTYRQSAGVLLRRLAASAGGHLYEGGNGAFIFEDYSQRDPAVVSIPKLRLSASHDRGGLPFTMESYSQPTTSQAGTVRVGSFGALVSIPSDVEASLAKVVFNLEGDFPFVVASDAVRTFFCRHNTAQGEGGQLIARRPFGFVLNLSGWTTHDTIQTPYAIGYGRGSDLVVKDDGGGNNVFVGMVGAESIQYRSNDRSFVDVGDTDPLMELEMPSQGYKTQAMTDLATWALAKYSNSPARLTVGISGLDVEHQLEIFGRDVGTPVWVYHPATEQGGFGLDHLFYVEGVEFEYRKGKKPILKLQLEES